VHFKYISVCLSLGGAPSRSLVGVGDVQNYFSIEKGSQISYGTINEAHRFFFSWRKLSRR
jgi:hypothetical protein